jgi:SAM-dependent methyltransferase
VVRGTAITGGIGATMRLYEYNSYADYVAAQREAHERKKTSVWVQPDVIDIIASRYHEAQMILCHGVRTGAEVLMFSERLPAATVIGTEIGKRPDNPQPYIVYEWDFHEQCDKWDGVFDIVYSNSFDHAYDPDKALSVWTDQLRPGGVLIIEWAERVAGKRGFHDKQSKPSDPLSGTVEEIADTVRRYINNVDVTSIHHAKSDRCYLICARRV